MNKYNLIFAENSGIFAGMIREIVKSAPEYRINTLNKLKLTHKYAFCECVPCEFCAKFVVFGNFKNIIYIFLIFFACKVHFVMV